MDLQLVFDAMAGIGCTEDSYFLDLSGAQPVLTTMTHGELCALYGAYFSCTVGTFEHARRAYSRALHEGQTRLLSILSFFFLSSSSLAL